MPLVKSASRKAISENIREMEVAGHPHKQAVAAALRTADEAQKRANGGQTPSAFKTLRHDINQAVHPGGLLTSHVAGRTDHLPLKVKAGSYVVPADVVSGLGEGNTLHGGKVLDHMFPLGSSGIVPTGKPAAMPYKTGGAVPIMAAGGEYVILPEAIIKKYGSLERGHKVLDAWVKHSRQKTIKTMKKLPGPAGSKEKH